MGRRRKTRSAGNPGLPGRSDVVAAWRKNADGALTDYIGLSIKTLTNPGGARPPKVDIVDYRSEYLKKADSTYFYSSSGGTIKRYNLADYSAAPDGVTLGGTLEIESIWPGNLAGVIFFQVRDTVAGTNFLYRSGDYGATAAEVDKIGWDADGWAANGNTPTHISGVTIFEPGFAYDKWNDQYVYVEYNNNPGKVAGADYDQVRLRVSSDGINWSTHAVWNTAGTRNFEYGHAVNVDPYDPYVYLCFGDGTPSGFIKWDGVSAIASNQDITAYSNALGGAGRYNAITMFFTATHISWGSNQYAEATEIGIWRVKKDLTGTERVYNDPPATGPRDFLFGLQTANGMYVTDFHHDEVDRTAYLYASSDGITWDRIARYQYQAKPGERLKIRSIFEANGKIYISTGDDLAGKGIYDTLVLEEEGHLGKGEPPVCIHPVYWVSASGSNSNNGFSPQNPFLTLKYALTSGKITYGARVIIGDGVFSEDSVVVSITGNPLPAVPALTNPIVIEGQGINNTEVVHKSNASSSSLLYFPDGEGFALFKKLRIRNEKAAAVYLIGFVNATAETLTEFEDCYLGAADDTGVAVLRLYNNRKARTRRTIIHANPVTSYCVQMSNSAGHKFYGDSSIFLGAKYTFNVEKGGIVLNNCAAYGYTSRMFRLLGTADILPEIFNTIFYGAFGAAYAIENATALVFSDANLDHNLFYNNTTNFFGVANNGGSHSILNQDPLFADPTTGDFRLQSISPCIGTGTKTALTGTADLYDASGIKIYDGTLQIPDGPYIDGVDIGVCAYQVGEKYYLRFTVVSGTGSTDWVVKAPASPDLINIIGVGNTLYDASGVPLEITWAALMAFEGPVYFGSEERNEFAVYDPEPTGTLLVRVNQYFKVTA